MTFMSSWGSQSSRHTVEEMRKTRYTIDLVISCQPSTLQHEKQCLGATSGSEILQHRALNRKLIRGHTLAMYRALYDFSPDAAVQGGLHLTANERYRLLDASNKHWWQVERCKDGENGLAPANYLEVRKQKVVLHSVIVPQRVQEVEEAFVVKYDFEGTKATQLTSKKGDQVIVVVFRCYFNWSSSNYRYSSCRKTTPNGGRQDTRRAVDSVSFRPNIFERNRNRSRRVRLRPNRKRRRRPKRTSCERSTIR